MTDESGGSGTTNGVGSVLAPGITFGGSLTSADMSYVWVYKSRLWFAQKDSMTAWYMDNADSIGGTAEPFPLGGVFGLGGSLLFGSRSEERRVGKEWVSTCRSRVEPL